MKLTIQKIIIQELGLESLPEAKQNKAFEPNVRIHFQTNSYRRLLFDVPNRGNRLALLLFNHTPRAAVPSAALNSGNGVLMHHGYAVVRGCVT